MNPTVILSLFSIAGFTLAAVVIILRKHNVNLSAGVCIPLILTVFLYDFIVASNFMEHSGITDYFDPLEDIAEIVFVFVFLFFVNNWRKERSEARFHDLFKLAPLPLAEVTRDGQIKEVNDILARNLEELFGVPIDDIQTAEHWSKLAYPDPAFREYAISAWEEDVNRILETGGALKPKEREITCKDGTKRTMIIGGSVIGENLLVSLFDITDRKRAEDEKEKMQEQMLQSQKLEAVGILAGGIAHDFNNMLGAIMGYTELTLADMGSDNEFRDNLYQILSATRRSIGLTRQLLAFARKQSVVPTVFDVNVAIDDTIKMLRRLIGENIELTWLPGAGHLNVKLDPSQFDQILANLCVNARDAIADVGKISLETAGVVIDKSYADSHAEFVPGDYIRLTFSDNGCGMDKTTLEHIFEPFYTTKGLGKGTGLGLATIYGIIKQNHGIISVYSEPERGTTFKIYLPRHSGEDMAVSDGIVEAVPKSRGETILIVEDDPLVLKISIAMLKRLAYAVLSADTPGEAVHLAEDKNNDIQMLITDLVMPEMNGQDLAERLRKIRPGMKNLFMSGYAANIIADAGVTEPEMNFIKKPFSYKDLAFKIREILDTN